MRVQLTHIYIYMLAALAAVGLLGWLHVYGLGFSLPVLGAALLLAAACAVSLRFQLEFGRIRVHMADVAVLAALVLLGPLWALLVAAPSMVYRAPLRVLFVSSCDVLKILSAGFVFQLFAAPLLFSPELGSSLVYGVVAAGAVFYALDALINCGLLLLKYGTPLKDSLSESILPLVPSDVISVLTVVGVSYAVVLFGPAVALVLFCGAAGALVSLHLIHERQRQNVALRAENESLLSSSLMFAGRLVESLEKRDGYTARHAAATSVYAGDIATEFGLDGGRWERLKVAALLQDVGLASVPDEVLVTPPGKLNSVGRMRLEEHPSESERVLASVPEFEEASRWVRWHHERPDGAGYPDRLRGGWIPLEAGILSVAERYAALVLDGPHSPGFSPVDARRELVGLSGPGLDPQVVRAFLARLDSEDGNYAAAADDRFVFPADSPKRSFGGPAPLHPADAAGNG